MKKGFTLVELLGVIVILSLVVILAVPQVLNLIKGSEQDLSDAAKEIIYNATELYITDNKDIYRSTEGNVYCISLTTLNNHNLIKTPLLDSVTGEEIPLSKQVEVKVLNNSYVYELKDTCTPIIDVEPNEPELFSNMIPVVYNETIEKWIYADTNDEWYDYSNKKWANAVVLKLNPSKYYEVGDSISMDDMAQMYVWIPRYKYTIFNGNNGSVDEQLINVTFEEGTATTGTVKCYDAVSGTEGTSSEVCTDSTNGGVKNGTSTYTHPAFCFGRKNTNGSCNGTELTGIWVGKFEVSGSASSADLTVLPNVNPLVSQNVSTYFTAMSGVANSFNIKVNDTTYADSHMMKNMEWGAVAYLKQSEYGLGTTDVALNNYYDTSKTVYYMTGCGSVVGTTATTTTCTPYDDITGQKASTTGNIYGVYDMNGGTWEYVMGNMVNTSNGFYQSSAGTMVPDTKYYDAYTYNTSNTTHGGGKLGDATKETLKTFGSTTGGWYGDYANFPSWAYSWFMRGGRSTDGANVGVFGFGRSNGGGSKSHSARLVLSRSA